MSVSVSVRCERVCVRAVSLPSFQVGTVEGAHRRFELSIHL